MMSHPLKIKVISENMKKILNGLVISILVSPVFLSSCEKERELIDLMIGRWSVQTLTQVNFVDNFKETAVTFFYRTDEMTVQFAEGGTGIVYENGSPSFLFTWSLNGSAVLLQSGDEVLEWDLVATEDTLVWSFSVTEISGNFTYRQDYSYSARRIPD
jgi:hypothetical protein